MTAPELTRCLAEQGDQPAPLFPVGPRIGSLFSGYGGLDMATQAVIGGEVVWHCEHEPPTKANPRPSQAAARLLAHRHPAVPNLGDIQAVDWASVAPIDVLTGGFPCTDVSSAGRRLGLRPDTRSGLWTHMSYAVDRLRPQLVLIENVRGLLSADAVCDLEPCPWCLGDDEGRPLRALGAVLGDLAQLGYDTRWVGLRAADVGAPHGRFRVFIAAWPAGSDPSALRRGTTRGNDGVRAAGLVPGTAADPDGIGPVRAGGSRGRRGGSADDGLTAADTTGVGRGEGRTEPAGVVGGSDAPVGGARATADADGYGFPGGRERDGEPSGGRTCPTCGDDAHGCAGSAHAAPEWGAYGGAVRRWELILGRTAPAPTMTGARGGQQLSPLFVEWLMGLPAGWVTDVPGLSRNDRLKMLGNGVVPQQAAAAIAELMTPLALAGVA